jgi:hypothetical protein
MLGAFSQTNISHRLVGSSSSPLELQAGPKGEENLVVLFVFHCDVLLPQLCEPVQPPVSRMLAQSGLDDSRWAAHGLILTCNAKAASLM